MKLIAALFFGLVAAQSFSDVPQCARSCLNAGVLDNSDCGVGDAGCICNASNYQRIVTASVDCAVSNCGADAAANNVIPALARVCAAVAGSNSFSTVTPDQTSTGATSSTTQKSVASSATQKGPTTSTTLQPEPTGGEREQADETVRGQTGLSSETIAGSVVGGVAALAIGVGLVVFLLRRKGRGTVAEEVKQGDETVAELDGKSNVIYELDAKTRPQPAELASERQVLELD